MSGRDVRRLAARATNMTHEAKRDLVARIAAGADAVGVTDLYVMREPFRIAAAALEHMNLTARVHVLGERPNNDARDTEEGVRRFLAEGCRTLVSLGGDGTNRAIVRALIEAGGGAVPADVTLIPLRTMTGTSGSLLSHTDRTPRHVSWMRVTESCALSITTHASASTSDLPCCPGCANTHVRRTTQSSMQIVRVLPVSAEALLSPRRTAI
jgi:hypothetical protein